jgi:hypothetical protein
MQSTTTQKAGKPLYDEMVSDFGYEQITWTMRRYNEGMSTERSEELLHAFLQWIALSPMDNGEKYITMFQTDVEEAFHCFVLNTALYQKFCDKFLGFFFHHNPLVEEEGPEVESAAKYTVELMEREYGDQLHPELKEWRKQFDAGTYKVACVGPGGHCPTT